MTRAAVIAMAASGFAFLLAYLFVLYQAPVFQIYLENWGLC